MSADKAREILAGVLKDFPGHDGISLGELRLEHDIAAALKAGEDAAWNAGRDAAVRRINEIADLWAQMPISDAYREIARSVGALARPPEDRPHG